MSAKENRLIDEALRLPLEARAALAGKLIESLDEEVDPDAESAWAEEVGRRIQQLDGGLVQGIPWDKARREILGS